jgi:hypothetical protein
MKMRLGATIDVYSLLLTRNKKALNSLMAIRVWAGTKTLALVLFG